MSESKRNAETIEDMELTPVVVGVKDGTVFYGEYYWGAGNIKENFNASHTGSIALWLHNCHMILSVSSSIKGWFDLAVRGPDAQCIVSPPVECAIISEITKVLTCSQAAAGRWKAQGSCLVVMPISGAKMMQGKNQ